VCRQLLEQGRSVVVSARSTASAERAAQELGWKQRGNILPAVLDVSDDKSIRQLARRIASDGIHLEALVNNAGVSLDGFDAMLARNTLQTNTLGPMRVADALVGALAVRGKVVNVSSGMGHLSGFGAKLRERLLSVESRAQLHALLDEFVADVAAGRHRRHGWPSNAYSVSKAGLNVFTRLLAAEQPGWHVNSVCPGWVRTDMGGSGAARSVDKGAAGIVWAATLASDGPTGGFFRDGLPIEW
jgi:NAD(P)-dependent dehydrogenase (short-subunit alcohol dehydrogenase family)